MAINNIATDVRNDIVDAVTAQIDAGAAGGTLAIYTSAFGTLLATLTFSTTSFGAASSGTATAASITSDSSADATGTAAVFRVADSDTNTVFEGTVGTSGADLNLNTVSITSGDTVSITSMTLTMPAS